MKISILGSRINVLPSYEKTFQEVLRYIRKENSPAYNPGTGPPVETLFGNQFAVYLLCDTGAAGDKAVW